MFRAVSWRRMCPERVTSRIEEALQARIYLLNQTGPTGFVVREEGAATKYKVVLGDLHSCSCPTFRHEKELCVHILWVILKKFRVPRNDPVVFQLSLVEREINELIYRHGCCTTAHTEGPGSKAAGSSCSHGKIQQKEITVDDVCPVCYDELLASAEAITYCSYSCGKSVHVRCMKMWAEHQSSSGASFVRCPLCREDFGPIEALRAEAYGSSHSHRPLARQRQDVHDNTTCSHCNVSPIIGKCYRCTVCSWYHLCSTCFHQQIHMEHSFEFKQRSLNRWRPVVHGRGRQLPPALLSDIQSRDLTADDYDLLNQLDSSAVDPLPKHIVESFPMERLKATHPLLSPGVQCRVCLCPFEVMQMVRVLPCRHRFHVRCIDQWLISERATCPVDGLTVPRVMYMKKRKPQPVNLCEREESQSGKLKCKQQGTFLPSIMGRQCSLAVPLIRSPVSDSNPTVHKRKKPLIRQAVPPSIPSTTQLQAHLPSLLVTNGLCQTVDLPSTNRERKGSTAQFRQKLMVHAGRLFLSPKSADRSANHLYCGGLRQQ